MTAARVLHLSDTHLLAAGGLHQGLLDTTAVLRHVLDGLAATHPAPQGRRWISTASSVREKPIVETAALDSSRNSRRDLTNQPPQTPLGHPHRGRPAPASRSITWPRRHGSLWPGTFSQQEER